MWRPSALPAVGADYRISHPGHAEDVTDSPGPTPAECQALQDSQGAAAAFDQEAWLDSLYNEGEDRLNITFTCDSTLKREAKSEPGYQIRFPREHRIKLSQCQSTRLCMHCNSSGLFFGCQIEQFCRDCRAPKQAGALQQAPLRADAHRVAHEPCQAKREKQRLSTGVD